MLLALTVIKACEVNQTKDLEHHIPIKIRFFQTLTFRTQCKDSAQKHLKTNGIAFWTNHIKASPMPFHKPKSTFS